jgi:hypothetical protein
MSEETNVKGFYKFFDWYLDKWTIHVFLFSGFFAFLFDELIMNKIFFLKIWLFYHLINLIISSLWLLHLSYIVHTKRKVHDNDAYKMSFDIEVLPSRRHQEIEEEPIITIFEPEEELVKDYNQKWGEINE